MRLRQYSVAITTTGNAGQATGSGTLAIDTAGLLEYLYFDYNASAPGTTDITVAFASTPPGGNVLVAADTVTDALKFPRAGCVTNANAAITDSHTKFPVSGPLTVSVAQSDALAPCVTVYAGVMVED